MRFWPAAWLIVMVLGVGGFSLVSVLIAVKGFAEVRTILRKLKNRHRDSSSPEP